MRCLTDRLAASAWLPPLGRVENRGAGDAEYTPDRTLRDKLERLAELQEERRQLGRSPAVSFGDADAAAPLSVPAVPPPLLRKVVEIEAEIEQLHSEIEREEEAC
jgi:hypothetical protein